MPFVTENMLKLGTSGSNNGVYTAADGVLIRPVALIERLRYKGLEFVHLVYFQDAGALQRISC